MVCGDGSRKTVALKSLKSNCGMSVDEFFNESNILREIKHPNIISLIGICSLNEPFYIVFEMEEKMDLIRFFRGPDGSLDIRQKTMICYQVSWLENTNNRQTDRPNLVIDT